MPQPWLATLTARGTTTSEAMTILTSALVYPSEGGDADTLARARVIAAAPDLLKQLKKSNARLNEEAIRWNSYGLLSDLINANEEVIRAALYAAHTGVPRERRKAKL